jgi:hypothetical protein
MADRQVRRIVIAKASFHNMAAARTGPRLANQRLVPCAGHTRPASNKRVVGARRWSREKRMAKQQTIKAALSAAAIAGFATLALAGAAHAQGAAPATADLSGTYQCKPNPSPCLWSGATASITQSGKKLQIKGTNGAMADASLTSDVTIVAGGTFNSLGIIRADKSIDWSDGTKWAKQ